MPRACVLCNVTCRPRFMKISSRPVCTDFLPCGQHRLALVNFCTLKQNTVVLKISVQINLRFLDWLIRKFEYTCQKFT